MDYTETDRLNNDAIFLFTYFVEHFDVRRSE